jgi:hypothetical protein
MDQSTLSVEHLEEVVESFVGSILQEITGYNSDDTDVEVDDADYIIERLEQPMAECVMDDSAVSCSTKNK